MYHKLLVYEVWHLWGLSFLCFLSLPSPLFCFFFVSEPVSIIHSLCQCVFMGSFLVEQFFPFSKTDSGYRIKRNCIL